MKAASAEAAAPLRIKFASRKYRIIFYIKNVQMMFGRYENLIYRVFFYVGFLFSLLKKTNERRKEKLYNKKIFFLIPSSIININKDLCVYICFQKK